MSAARASLANYSTVTEIASSPAGEAIVVTSDLMQGGWLSLVCFGWFHATADTRYSEDHRGGRCQRSEQAPPSDLCHRASRTGKHNHSHVAGVAGD